jgi:HPt (histidine-containing phosphotransfer) domain-containing protein
MPHLSEQVELYYSALAGEPDMVELIELFVAELPGRLSEMRRAESIGDWAQVGRLAHQLKGAGGSYGFPHLTAAALELEQAARSMGTAIEAAAALNRLGDACGVARAGLPHCPAAECTG